MLWLWLKNILTKHPQNSKQLKKSQCTSEKFTKMITLTETELDEIIKGIRNLNLYIDDYLNAVRDEILIDTTTDACLFLDISIEQPEYRTQITELDYFNGSGYFCNKVSDGDIHITKVKPYHETVGFTEFDEYSMNKILKELSKWK